jgi:hypothetical protein
VSVSSVARADGVTPGDELQEAALGRLREVSDAVAAGVDAHLAAYLVGRASRVLDAWGRVTDRARADAQVADAASRAAGRVTTELRALFAEDPAAQHATPLEIVRTAAREPAAVLEDAGVAPVVRDEFEERAFPDDRYGLAPHALADIDEQLAPLQLAWGMAKAQVLRARSGSGGPE